MYPLADDPVVTIELGPAESHQRTIRRLCLHHESDEFLKVLETLVGPQILIERIDVEK